MHTWSGYGMGWGMGLGMILMWLVPALAFLAIWAWAMSARQGWRSRDTASQVLRERYARGEIDGDTLQRMLQELSTHTASGGRSVN